MQLPEQSRYVIIGAGIHGLSTAWHLARELKARGRGSGEDVLVIDKTSIAAGASGIACGVDTTSDAPIAVHRGLQRNAGSQGEYGAGSTMREDALPAFRESFEAVARERRVGGDDPGQPLGRGDVEGEQPRQGQVDGDDLLQGDRVALRLQAWQENSRAWHPLTHLQRAQP